MNEKAGKLPKNYFPIKITVGTGLTDRFVEQAKERHDVVFVRETQLVNDLYEEAVIAVPFADKEMLRVEFNIFASEMEREHGIVTDFLMESATDMI